MNTLLIRAALVIGAILLVPGCAAPGPVPSGADGAPEPDVEAAAPQRKSQPQSLPSIKPQTTHRNSNAAALRLLLSADELQRDGALSQAASMTERAIRIDPRESKAYYRLASIRQQQGQFSQALELAKKALHWQPDSMDLKRELWLLMADCYDALGDSAAAERARQQGK